MALLDLQTMEQPVEEVNAPNPHSGASKDCASHISLLLC